MSTTPAGLENRGSGIVWNPPPELTNRSNLRAFLEAHHIADYDELLCRADTDPEWFWGTIVSQLDFFKPYESVMDLSRGPAFARWCVGGTTNVVLNCIDRHRNTDVWSKECIVWEAEGGELRKWTYQELSSRIDSLARGLRAAGCRRGEVVGLYVPNIPETVVAFFAVAKIGAIVMPLFSGFGASALIGRLNDAGASMIIAADGTFRRGSLIAMKDVLDEAAREVPTLRHVLVVKHAGNSVRMQPGRDIWLHDLESAGSEPVPTLEMDSEEPLLLMYTSGTSGKPKGTVHTHCGFAAKLRLDLGLMLDVKGSDRLLWMSDMGWMVGPLLAVGTTLFGASMVLAEGGPDYPDAGRMWRLVDEQNVSFLGIAPTMARAFIKNGDGGLAQRSLASLRICASTGEAWTPDAWWWTFENVCRKRVPILNYSGGTEVGGGILSGTVLHSMKPCAFSGPIPGMGADIVTDNGQSVPRGTVGELVLRKPSVGMTRSLWKSDERYLDAYWNAMPGVWVHGDWAYVDNEGFWFIVGRSDDTLKIAGKRTGPAEIEGILLATGKVAEAAVVGLPDPLKGQALGCLVMLIPNVEWSNALRKELEQSIVSGLGAPYRPMFIVHVSDLPKTRNMKIMRRVIKAACLGENAGDLSSLLNPASVDEIRTVVGQAVRALEK
jgi:acetyl-CoA synthetase